MDAPVACLLGPTGSGKSALAMALAEALPVEIVSMDSAQVYRGMDIGTAKPTLEERARVPHHLVDVIGPDERYSAARFREDAIAAIRAIRARGRLPLVVGGTMLYYRALAEGIDDLPEANPEVRASIDAEAAREGWPALHAELARVDPATAARLQPTDAQRIQRALEIWRVTGRPMSAQIGARAAGAPVSLRAVAMPTPDRAALHAKLAERFDAMLAAGLVDELRALRSRYRLDEGLPSMRCVGYRQAWEFLEVRCTAAELRERGIAATRQLAKRQLTWLRSFRDVNEATPDALRRALAA